MAGYEQIWAPWRMAYILGEDFEEDKDQTRLEFLPGADPQCFLCRSVADHRDRERHVVRRGQHCVALLNRYPYNNGHLLIAPRRHEARLDGLTAEEHLALSQEIAGMVQLLERVLEPEGFNVGLNLGRAAGAGLPGHLHWHIVPRWMGDTNFMPTLAAIKIIPQSLETLWDALTAALKKSPDIPPN